MTRPSSSCVDVLPSVHGVPNDVTPSRRFPLTPRTSAGTMVPYDPSVSRAASPHETGSTVNRMMKRLVVATFASAVAILPLSVPAQADAASSTKVVKVAPEKSGGATTNRIDWE